MRLLRSLFFFFASLLLTTAAGENLTPIPSMSSPVIDLVGLLHPDQRASLQQKLWEREEKTGSQVVILVVDSTRSEAIEQYARRVFDLWGVGRKGIDDGVLLIIAAESGLIRLETGYGVEGVITDVIATRIVRDIIVPEFERKDYYVGLNAGITAIHTQLNKGSFPPPAKHKPGGSPLGNLSALWLLLFLPIIAIIFIAATKRMKRSRSNSEDGKGKIVDPLF